MIFIFDFRQQRLREKKRLLRVDSLKRKMRRRAEKPKVTLYPTSLSQSSHCEINDKTDTSLSQSSHCEINGYLQNRSSSSKLGNALMIATKICRSQKN